MVVVRQVIGVLTNATQTYTTSLKLEQIMKWRKKHDNAVKGRDDTKHMIESINYSLCQINRYQHNEWEHVQYLDDIAL